MLKELGIKRYKIKDPNLFQGIFPQLNSSELCIIILAKKNPVLETFFLAPLFSALNLKKNHILFLEIANFSLIPTNKCLILWEIDEKLTEFSIQVKNNITKICSNFELLKLAKNKKHIWELFCKNEKNFMPN